MKKEIMGISGILKLVVAVLILAFVVILYLFVSGGRKPFEEMAAVMETVLEDSGLEVRSGQDIRKTFGLDTADFSGSLYYRAPSAGSAEEVLLIRTKSQEQALAATEVLRNYLKSREKWFEGYNMEQAELVRQAKLSVRGTFVFLAVSSDAVRYMECFSRSL